MHKVSDLLTNKRLTKTTVATTTGLNKSKPTVKTTDLVLGEAADLINAEFRPWYALKAYKLGRERFLNLASIARADGRDPQRLFSFLLKAENGNG